MVTILNVIKQVDTPGKGDYILESLNVTLPKLLYSLIMENRVNKDRRFATFDGCKIFELIFFFFVFSFWLTSGASCPSREYFLIKLKVFLSMIMIISLSCDFRTFSTLSKSC